MKFLKFKREVDILVHDSQKGHMTDRWIWSLEDPSMQVIRMILICLKEYLWLDRNAKNEYYKAGVANKQLSYLSSCRWMLTFPQALLKNCS